MQRNLFQREKFASIQQAQAGLTKLLARAEHDASFYRVLRGSKPVGVLLPNAAWEGLLEDLAALSSPRYLRAIAAARKDLKRVSAGEAKKRLRL